jgi:phage terminase Nu1 subunit (DNA packaging protein)
LFVLDKDSDIFQFRGGYVDFHPWIRHPYPHGRVVVPQRCELDPEVVRTAEVERLIDTLDEQGRAQLHLISRLPRTMTNFFLSMYQSQVDSLKANIERWNNQVRHRDTRPETRRILRARIAQAEAELARIEPFLAPLEAFQARLNEIEDELRAQVEARIPQEVP